MAELYLTLVLNPKYPTAEVPRRRFDKLLEVAPWSGVVEATIYLDDPTWELLGYPKELYACFAPRAKK